MIYDVSLPISADMATWPGDPRVTCEEQEYGPVHISCWTLGSHTGTHVDAPVHFSCGPLTVDCLDPTILIGPCLLVDLSRASMISADVLQDVPLAGVERILFRTRNSQRWQQDPTTFFKDYIALESDAAGLLRDHSVRLVGIDSFSIESPGGSGEVHEILLSAGIVVLEGLALAGPPAGMYRLICAPLRLANADGAPARVFLEDLP